MFRRLTFALFVLVQLTHCNLSSGPESSGDSTPPADSSSSSQTTDSEDKTRAPANNLLISDGSGYTPVSGHRTYDYGDWYILSTESDWSKTDSIVWEWNPLNETEFTQDQKDAFIGAREGKFVHDRKWVLVAGSNGGIALIRYYPKKLLFYANVGANTNPHSVDLLPDGTIVTTSSNDNRLTVISTASIDDRSISSIYTQHYSLTGAHGVYWDESRKSLWAIGTTLEEFEYNDDRWAPQLNLLHTFSLPSDNNGHDVFPQLSGEKFFATSNGWSGTFDPETSHFDAIPSFTPTGVKSMSQGSVYDSGNLVSAVAYTFPVNDSRIANPALSWWTETVSFFTTDGRTITKTVPGARIYKARF